MVAWLSWLRALHVNHSSFLEPAANNFDHLVSMKKPNETAVVKVLRDREELELTQAQASSYNLVDEDDDEVEEPMYERCYSVVPSRDDGDIVEVNYKDMECLELEAWLSSAIIVTPPKSGSIKMSPPVRRALSSRLKLRHLRKVRVRRKDTDISSEIGLHVPRYTQLLAESSNEL
ncbi:hypothetical protein Tco_1201437 [Tanacetum coccineum]